MTYLVIHNVGLYLSRKNNLPICTSIRPGVRTTLCDCYHAITQCCLRSGWPYEIPPLFQ